MSTPWDSTWPELAEAGEKDFLLGYMNNRFGMNKNIFTDYLLLKKKKSYWFLRKSRAVQHVTGLKVEAAGIKAFQEVGSFIKPTTRIIQFFGHRAEKAVIKLDNCLLRRLINGEYIQSEADLENGYVILTIDSGVLGLGLIINGKIRSQLSEKDVMFMSIGI